MPLKEETDKFIADLNYLFVTVFGIANAMDWDPDSPFKLNKHNNRVAVIKNVKDIPLIFEKAPHFECFLEVYFELEMNSTGDFLAVCESKYQPYIERNGKHNPLVRIDYIRKPNKSSVPKCHIQIYPDQLYNAQGKKTPGNVTFLRTPLEKIHFPVGGSLMRPCLEEVLLMLDMHYHLGFDKKTKAFLKERRKDFKKVQILSLAKRYEKTLEEAGWTKPLK